MTSLLKQHLYSKLLHQLTYVSATCPKTWIYLRDSCYKFSNRTLIWSEAQYDCEALGSNLAIVNSRAEQKALASYVKEQTWIGLQNVTSRWLWVDGSAATYTHWIPDQPDNHLGAEHCAEMKPGSSIHKGRWNDINCNTHLNYVCEISGKPDMMMF